ncbi:alpha/beta fold hydrolase [Nitratireductor pacificus]|uniref:Alpha/beta hydrolase fold protein n=1 Tax=Nitratireductor pacificus pht-3B TaxID=391937 RepID=K2N0Y9_9HYPH|nr:alpha/beta fold hydrolase [Nitratireductor pacificus]EKF17923.1 alpha/beta hydrolase fold protein [Nitratireductor pacificus pht-3B]
MDTLSLRIIRGLFGTIEHVAPRLAGRFAFALFCRTPNPRRLSARESAALAGAGNFMKRARWHRLKSAHGSFMAYEFTNWNARRDGPAVLVLHGWRSRAEHMRAVIEALLARGFRVVALDLPGHGRAAGRRLHMPNAVAAVQEATLWLGPFDTAIGHSFGGAVALNAAAGSVRQTPLLSLRRLVMIASPDSMPRLFRLFGRAAGLGPRTQAAFEGRVLDLTGAPLETMVGARLLENLRLPTLIIHAPEDKEVPAEDARAMAASGDHVSLAWASGLGHRRILGDAAVAAHAAEFAASRPERALPKAMGSAPDALSVHSPR